MSDFPAHWPVASLGDLVEVLDARRIPVSAKERANRPGPIPYYGASGQVGTIDAALFNEPLLLLGKTVCSSSSPRDRRHISLMARRG